MDHSPISIMALSSISPLGNSLDTVWRNYLNDEHCIEQLNLEGSLSWAACLKGSLKKEIEELRLSESSYNNLDKSVLYALYASRSAVKHAGWNDRDNFGINIGSSRGATGLFEKYHREFMRSKRTPTLTSPTTTLGNISSWVAHDLNSKGPEISHSITCSTALHGLLNGMAWIQSGMADKFLVGGSEAPLTSFTIAQMKALKIYAPHSAPPKDVSVGSVGETAAQPSKYFYPCRSLDLSKKHNSMILGEGASMACLEKGIKKNALAIIQGVGYATEPLNHSVSLSAKADCFQRSMKMALADTSLNEVDVIVMHAPGTIKGDISEYHSIQEIFGDKLPFLTTNKWKIGHTLGTSGMLSIEMAILMLKHQIFIKVPFLEYAHIPPKIDKILVNAVGFGGNAVSVLLTRQ